MVWGSAAISRLWASRLGALGHWQAFSWALGQALWAMMSNSAAGIRIRGSRLGAPGR